MWEMDTLSLEPAQWSTTNFLYYLDGGLEIHTERSTDAHGGMYSLKLGTHAYMGDSIMTAAVLRGK